MTDRVQNNGEAAEVNLSDEAVKISGEGAVPSQACEKEAPEEKPDIIASLKAENNELQDRLLRRLADFENYKKRVAQEKEIALREKMGAFFLELLPVTDNFERALSNLNEETSASSLAEGVKLIHKQLLNVLTRFDLKEIDTEGGHFDPHLHQAFDREYSQEPLERPMISKVFQKGYTFQGIVLRPSLVKVRLPKEENTAPSPEEGCVNKEN